MALNIVQHQMSLAELFPLHETNTGLVTRYFPMNLAAMTAAAVVLGNYTITFHGRLRWSYFVTTTATTTAGAAATLTPSLNGVPMTSGILALTTAGCGQGEPTGGVFAEEIVAPGDVLSVIASLPAPPNQAFLDGSGVYELTLWNDDMREVMAKLATMAHVL